MTTAIRIENVSKLYRLGTVGTGTISHDLNRWWHQIRGKEDPYAKIGQVNDRTKKSGKSSAVSRQSSENAAAGDCQLPTEDSRASGPDYVWALKDINLEVAQGEILGIIGRNGAGKSTLLKLLSRVTAPTTGSIKTKGRIASLLEVGTGFHPDLTGRENIYMNGAILGMRRTEITRQLEEIVEFSGCARYLDTPVKRYSSGMTVRLGFAVAAHLQCELLIIDEVLAVGDAEFQKRCLSRMREVSSDQGRTVIFVSHNMSAMQALTHKVVWMANGRELSTGAPDRIISQYLSEATAKSPTSVQFPKRESSAMVIREVTLGINASQQGDRFAFGEGIPVTILYDINQPVYGAHIACILEQNDIQVFTTGDADLQIDRLSLRSPGSYKTTFMIPPRLLNEGRYSLTITSGKPFLEVFDRHASVVSFEICDQDRPIREYIHNPYPGVVSVDLPWQLDPIHE
jgi:lipopolysaccharide transport system ATP-binding protein